MISVILFVTEVIRFASATLKKKLLRGTQRDTEEAQRDTEKI